MTVNDAATGPHGETVPGPGGPNRTIDQSFFGHPRGLGFLAGTEMWERFSFYGMRNILTVFLVSSLLMHLPEGDRAGAAAVVPRSGRRSKASTLGPVTSAPHPPAIRAFRQSATAPARCHRSARPDPAPAVRRCHRRMQSRGPQTWLPC